MNESGFKITRGHGFHITFSNGVTVSVQFGWANYCKNYPYNAEDEKEMINNGKMESPNAEIAIFDKDQKWLTNKWNRGLGDDVKGYVTPEEVLRALNWAEKYKEKEMVK